MAVNRISGNVAPDGTPPGTQPPAFTLNTPATARAGHETTDVPSSSQMRVMARTRKSDIRPASGPVVLPYPTLGSIFPHGKTPASISPDLRSMLTRLKLPTKKAIALWQKVDPDLRTLPVAETGKGKVGNDLYTLDVNRGTIDLSEHGSAALQVKRKQRREPPVRVGDTSDIVWTSRKTEWEDHDLGRQTMEEAWGLKPSSESDDSKTRG